MLPDLLVASSRRSELRIVSHHLRDAGDAVPIREPMDALWVAADRVLVATKDPDGGAAITQMETVARSLVLGASVPVGQLPCALRAIGGIVFVACYSGGRVDALEYSAGTKDLVSRGAIDLEGAFPAGPREASGRQGMSHPHDVVALDEGRRALICDLGADRLYVIDTMRLRIIDAVVLLKGAGPRKALVTPSGDLVVVCELDSTIRCFQLAAGRYVQTDCVPTTGGARDLNFPGDLVATAGGVLVVANRGNGTLAGFAVEDGRLRTLFEDSGGGAWPASLDLREGVVAVANERSGSVDLFRVSPSGLDPVASAAWAAPSLVRFAP
ncbi:lactonase family protein [Microbacterium saperdae]